jgi:hypothetical protein
MERRRFDGAAADNDEDDRRRTLHRVLVPFKRSGMLVFRTVSHNRLDKVASATTCHCLPTPILDQP